MLGTTITEYTIAKNVVKPAKTSCRTLLPRAEMWNQASSFPLAGRDSPDICNPQYFCDVFSRTAHVCRFSGERFLDENPGKRLRRRVILVLKGDAEKRQTIIWRLLWGFQLLINDDAA